MISMFAVTFVLNTILVSNNGVVTEYCNINIDGVNQSMSVDSCVNTGQMLVESWEDKYPGKPWHLVVDGYDYNAM